MKQLSRTILNFLWDEVEIPEDLLYEFTVKTTKIVQTRCIEDLPTEFWDIERYVASFWHAQRFEHVSASHIYEMGRLLSLTNMLGMIAEEEEKRQSLDEYAVRFQDWYLAFKGMHDRPGITHKELAAVAKKSESSLSQFMNKNQWECLYMYRRFGREKNYYLTEMGQELYEMMKRRRPHPAEEKYTRCLGAISNLENVVAEVVNDRHYKVVKSDDGEFIEDSIYIVNCEDEARRIGLVAQIRLNKSAFEDKKEDKEIWQKEERLKKLKAL